MAKMLNRILTLESFIDLVIHIIKKLIPHSFIARKHTKYLYQEKHDLTSNETIILGDLAENCQCIIEYEILGVHWKSSQCTLHPIAIYCKVKNNIQNHSFCFPSNYQTNNVDMIYEAIKNAIVFFYNWDSRKRKRSTKRLNYTGNLFRKNLQLKMSVDSRLRLYRS